MKVSAVVTWYRMSGLPITMRRAWALVMATLNLDGEIENNYKLEMISNKPLPVLQEANLGQLILLEVVRVAPDGGDEDDPPLLALEFLGGSNHHLGGLSQLHPDLLALSPVG